MRQKVIKMNFKENYASRINFTKHSRLLNKEKYNKKMSLKCIY
ncbi:hypothetical protein EU94_0964 [Prochlorococcus marinus str. MIT 9123]|uniref:Uncharacterized protein n=1 Tax=Prochlorococcus marinus str. MIT 9116 TaxID=167544 RepID=A0A0A1ZZ50_PROMR|nr:hypothetical protein EU93_0158 [Prochlorococcus marinus str. MIT 9116]KGF94058.1 hypothetical protein EU94_0964 [Prochlorococcus marinus str. MIT 9123]